MNDLLQPITNENKIGKDIDGLPVLNPLNEKIRAMLEAWAQNDIQAGEFANEIKKKATDILTQQSKHLRVYVALSLSLTVEKGIEGFKEGLENIQKALEIFPNMYPQLEKKREYEATVFLGNKYKLDLIKVLSGRDNVDHFLKILEETKDISCKITDKSFGAPLCEALKKASSELSISHASFVNEAGEAFVQDITQGNPNKTDWPHSHFNHEAAIHQLRHLKTVFERADPYNPVNIALDLALLWCQDKDINHLLAHREDMAKVAEFVKKLKKQSEKKD